MNLFTVKNYIHSYKSCMFFSSSKTKYYVFKNQNIFQTKRVLYRSCETQAVIYADDCLWVFLIHVRMIENHLLCFRDVIF